MKKNLLNIYQFIGKIYFNQLLLIEQKKPDFKVINERALEYAFALKHLTRLCPNNILDIGPGKSSWPHTLANCGFQVTAIDKVDKYWKGTHFNRHFHVINDDITAPRLKKTFKFITCISVLEHIQEHKMAVKNMFKLLEPKGHLLLTFPYNEKQYNENIYKHPDAGYGKDKNFITQIFSQNEINEWINESPFQLIEQEYYRIFSGQFWTFGERILPPQKVDSSQTHHLTCLLLQKKNEITIA